MKIFAVNLLATIFVILLGFALYDRLVIRPFQQIGVIDIGEIYRIKEHEFTEMVTKGATDADRQKAHILAEQFAKRLPQALEELPGECNCLVLLKSAMAGSTPHTTDLTALLKRKVEQQK